MRRLLAFLPVLAVMLTLVGCATSTARVVRDREPVPGVALQEPAAGGGADAGRAAGPGFGDYALVLPKNVVWVPWKIVAGTGKGLVDGVSAGFGEGKVPILGVIFSPLNAVMGLVTGLGTGIVSEPVFVGPTTNFGRTMGLPTQRPTPIWWLTK